MEQSSDAGVIRLAPNTNHRQAMTDDKRKKQLMRSSWQRNAFWRILLMLMQKHDLVLCEKEQVEDEIIYRPVDQFRLSNMVLDAHDVDGIEVSEKDWNKIL